jgi:hypothetical protein
MADAPHLHLRFEGHCPDCGVREAQLPAALPDAGDDFDWRVRDYDGYRMFMLEELHARFPERKRWTPGRSRGWYWWKCWRGGALDQLFRHAGPRLR